MEVFDKLGMDVADLIGPWIAILISIAAAFWFKDFVTNFMEVLLDGEQAIIVKIGLRETVFGTYGPNGYTWRYVSNARIEYLKLEKIINKDLHLDSDVEKGIRLQSLIDRAQSSGIRDNMNNIHDNGKKIQENKDDIEALKNGKK
jgi:hypothetical protein